MVIAFGEGTRNRLGTESVSNTEPKLCKSTRELKPSKILSTHWHSVLVDKEKDIYRAGYVKNTGSENSQY
jgi:hypothetical protein